MSCARTLFSEPGPSVPRAQLPQQGDRHCPGKRRRRRGGPRAPASRPAPSPIQGLGTAATGGAPGSVRTLAAHGPPTTGIVGCVHCSGGRLLQHKGRAGILLPCRAGARYFCPVAPSPVQPLLVSFELVSCSNNPVPRPRRPRRCVDAALSDRARTNPGRFVTTADSYRR